MTRTGTSLVSSSGSPTVKMAANGLLMSGALSSSPIIGHPAMSAALRPE